MTHRLILTTDCPNTDLTSRQVTALARTSSYSKLQTRPLMASHLNISPPREIKIWHGLNFWAHLPAILYGCETWSLTLSKEHRLRVFENRVLKKIFGRRGMRWRENGENRITRSFVTCTLRQVIRMIESGWMKCAGHIIWISGQSSWQEIQRSWFDSWRSQIFWVVVGLERVHSASWVQLRSYLKEKVAAPA
jgi:hypothetical protein